MEQSVEKSCWGITLWAVGIVICLALLISLFSGNEPSAAIAVVAPVSS